MAIVVCHPLIDLASDSMAITIKDKENIRNIADNAK